MIGLLYLVLLLASLTLSYGDYATGSYCFDDVCAHTDEEARIYFEDIQKDFKCPEPYATCDVAKEAYQFCFDNFGYTGLNRSICATTVWRMYSIKELLMVTFQFPNTLPSGINSLGFKRTNKWFEHTMYLSGVLARNLIAPLGEEFVFGKPLRILEVGSYEGGSATWYIRYLMSHPESTITCVDPWSPELRNDACNSSLVFDTFEYNIAQTGISPDRVRVLRNDSILALSSLLLQGEQFDHIYIDGSHELHDVVADIALAWRLLAVDGVMTLDDVPWRHEDKSYYAPQQYTYTPEGETYPHCLTIGQREHYKLEDAISAVVSNLPNADVVYCHYHLALKKRA